MLFIVLFILSRSTASGQTFLDIENNTEIRNETTTEVLVRNDFERIGTFHENMFYDYESETYMSSEILIPFCTSQSFKYKKSRRVPLNTVH